jgi:hypothetical protein
MQIFFPRSIEGEIAARDEAKERKQSRQGTRIGIDTQASFGNRQLDTYLLTSSPVQKAHFDEHELHDMPYGGSHQYRHDEEGDVGDLPLPIKTKMLDLTEANLALRNKGTRQSVNPMIFNFTSPIGRLFVRPRPRGQSNMSTNYIHHRSDLRSCLTNAATVLANVVV